MSWQSITGQLFQPERFVLGVATFAGFTADLWSRFMGWEHGQLAIVVGVLVAVDTVMGIVVSRYYGRQISSAKLERMIVKLVVYSSLVILAGAVEAVIDIHGIIVRASMVALIVREAVSIIELINTTNLLPDSLLNWLRTVIETKAKDEYGDPSELKGSPQDTSKPE